MVQHADIDHSGVTGAGATAHIADATDAHDASAISVLDSGTNFTGTDVEAVLAELQDNIDAVSGGGAEGYTPWAGSPGLDNTTATFAVTRSMAAVSGGNAGAVGALVFVTAPMKLRSISVWNKNTATARAAEGRVYSIGTSANAAFVTGTDAAWSFTPSAASLRAATVSGAPVDLDPGYYLVVIRNTSATQTFDVGAETQGTPNMLKGSCVHSLTASVAALGSTIDVTGWSRAGSIIGIQLDGEIFGTGAAWDA